MPADRTQESFRDPHVSRHPFIMDAEDGIECAACGKYGHARIHRDPFEMSREDAEACCEPA